MYVFWTDRWPIQMVSTNTLPAFHCPNPVPYQFTLPAPFYPRTEIEAGQVTQFPMQNRTEILTEEDVNPSLRGS